MILYFISIVAALVSVLGWGYLLGATLLTRRLGRRPQSIGQVTTAGVTILKPLHGAEPGLFENLDDRFHESCHFGGIHSGWLDSHVGPVSPNGAGWKSWQRGGGRLNCRSGMRIRPS